MGLDQILDITETQVPGPQGNLVKQFQVIFTTEATTGSFTVEIPADEFSPDAARAQAEARAEEIDQAFQAETEE